jgi:hypothetical protein
MLGLAGLACTQVKPEQAPPRNTQVQATRQFLAAALRGDTAAYKWLAPELRRQLGAAGVQQALGAVAAAGHRRGPEIELYKMGFQLEEDGTARPFVAYGWAADSAMRLKKEWLQVTFRDTAARLVQGFEVRQR